MALIVEDGTGVANAESYISVSDADSFLSGELGHDVWTGESTQGKERALRMATRIIDTECRWRGWKSAATNVLEWPRTEAQKDERDDEGDVLYFDDDEIPTRLKQSAALFASRLASEPNYMADLDDARVASSSTDVGSKSYRGQRQVDTLPAAVRGELRSLCNTGEIPVMRVA